MIKNSTAAKAIVNIPAWAEAYNNGQLGGREVSSTATAYAFVPLLYRAVRLRCDSLASVPIAIMSGENESEWPFDEDLYSLIWMTEAALLLTGAAFWLKLSNRIRVKDIRWINPLMMRVDWINGQRVFSQISSDKNEDLRTFDPGEIVFFREFNISDDVGFGVSAAQVAMSDTQTINYINLFVNQFFKGGAMPVTLLGIEGMSDPKERDRIEGWFKQRIVGIRNAFKVLALSRVVKPEILTPPMADMAFPDLLGQARKAIADAFGIPQTMLEDAANYATAAEHRLSFWSDTVRPRGPMIEGVINRGLLKPMGLEMKFKFDQMDIFKKDELEAASAMSAFVNAGYPLGLASEVVGVELPEDWDYAKLDALQEQRRQEAAEQFEANSQNKDEKPDNQKEDLQKWQRKAMKRLDKGQSPACTFESEYIPAVMAAAIGAQLEQAQTKEDVKAIFEGKQDNKELSIDLVYELKRANDLLEMLDA